MHRPQLSSLLFPLLLAPLPGSAMLDCKKIVVDDHKFNLDKLGGPHSVVTTQWNAIAETHINTTYTLDICNTLKKSGDAPKSEQCPMGTRGEHPFDPGGEREYHPPGTSLQIPY